MSFRFRLASFFVVALILVQSLTGVLVYQVTRNELIGEGKRQLQVAAQSQSRHGGAATRGYAVSLCRPERARIAGADSGDRDAEAARVLDGGRARVRPGPGRLHASRVRAPIPMRFRPFVEMDDKPGFYAALGWQPSSQHRVTALYYDNHADLSESVRYAGRTLRAWRTYFWNIGAEQRFGEWALLGQAMHGSTIFEPVPGRLILNTEFNAGYLMFAREHGAWQPALRVDLFQTRQRPAPQPRSLSEHGNAVTLALNWRPQERIRVTGEVLRIDSSRNQRRRDGLDARQVDMQLQLGVRLFF